MGRFRRLRDRGLPEKSPSSFVKKKTELQLFDDMMYMEYVKWKWLSIANPDDPGYRIVAEQDYQMLLSEGIIDEEGNRIEEGK